MPCPATGSLTIAVIGANRLGLCSALVLAQRHRVVLLDERPERVHMVNAALSPVQEPEIAHYLAFRAERLRATLFPYDAVCSASLILVATPSRHDPRQQTADTREISAVLQRVTRLNPRATVVIESSVPTGYTLQMAQRLRSDRLVAAPVPIRPGCALRDRLNPACLIVGNTSAPGREYARLIGAVLADRQVPTLFTGASEAEAIHLLAQERRLRRASIGLTELARYARDHALDLGQLAQGLARLRPAAPHRDPPHFSRHNAEVTIKNVKRPLLVA